MTVPIFFERSGEAHRADEQPFASEAELQELLAASPDLLGGDLGPMKWLLVKREFTIPHPEDQAGYIFLDHLFLDQHGKPTLVECKMTWNGEYERAVLGQVLDYAAGLHYLGPDPIRDAFEARCIVEGLDPAKTIRAVLGLDEEDLWAKVASNLGQRKLRLLFAGDQISSTVKRVIEFLNVECPNLEVLALEVERWGGLGGQRVLQSRLIGATAASEATASGGQVWTLDDFLSELERLHGSTVKSTIEDGLAVFQEPPGRLSVGSGAGGLNPYIIPIMGTVDDWCPALGLHLQMGYVWFQWLTHAAYPDEIKQEFLTRLRQVPGLTLSNDNLTGRPRFEYSCLAAKAARQPWIEAMKWFRQVYLDSSSSP